MCALFLTACTSSGALSASREPAPEAPTLRVATPPAAVVDASAALSSPPADVEPAAPEAASGDDSTSLGSVSNGRLLGGVALPLTGPGYRFNERRPREARYATAEVVRAITQAAQQVATRYPGSELTVNDLSLEQGGKIAHHGSHRAGRDADILFYLRGDDGQPIRSVGAPIDPEGIGSDYRDLSRAEDDVRVHFDAERTWAFVAALLVDREAVVQRIFVAEHLRSMLLAAAEQASAARDIVARFADVTCQPSYPHDDHLHVRWFCSVQDIAQGCEDLPPLYPFHVEALAALGAAPVLAKHVRSLDPAPVTTQAQADKAVAKQKPHPAVLAFLKRRKAWDKQPHPGRPYCR